MLQDQVDCDKQTGTQAFFAPLSDEMIAVEFPACIKKWQSLHFCSSKLVTPLKSGKQLYSAENPTRKIEIKL